MRKRFELPVTEMFLRIKLKCIKDSNSDKTKNRYFAEFLGVSALTANCLQKSACCSSITMEKKDSLKSLLQLLKRKRRLFPVFDRILNLPIQSSLWVPKRKFIWVPVTLYAKTEFFSELWLNKQFPLNSFSQYWPRDN